MERIFQILAVVLACVSAYFLYHRNSDGAFVSAVLGAVSFFLSVRFQVKARNQQREAEAAELDAGNEQTFESTENGGV